MELNFSEYITSISASNSIIVKAKQRLFLLRKSFITKDANALLVGYKTDVLPIMDYQ